MTRLKGKTALITAAGQGIGRSIAAAFIREGARVIATDRDVSLLKGLNCEHVALDVCSVSDINSIHRKFEYIDILSNNAGFVHNGTILECNIEDWEMSFSLNVTSMYLMSKCFIPYMIERGKGSIVNTSSVASSIKGVKTRFAYGSSKAAVIGLTKSIAADFVEKGIRCNAICPGTIETPSLRQRLSSTGDYDSALKSFTARQPIGRLGTPEEVAHLAVYLASDESGFTTGQTHIVDGGWTN